MLLTDFEKADSSGFLSKIGPVKILFDVFTMVSETFQNASDNHLSFLKH